MEPGRNHYLFSSFWDFTSVLYVVALLGNPLVKTDIAVDDFNEIYAVYNSILRLS